MRHACEGVSTIQGVQTKAWCGSVPAACDACCCVQLRVRAFDGGRRGRGGTGAARTGADAGGHSGQSSACSSMEAHSPTFSMLLMTPSSMSTITERACKGGHA
jgi:hypothetical protein